jgi:predicted GNAT family acetyltransferase
MEVVELPDVGAFLAAAEPVLLRDPAANNLPLGIAQQLVDRPGSYDEAFFWVARRGGAIVGAAIRTPPYPVVLAEPLAEEAVEAFVGELVRSQPGLPGVTANEPWASRFADAWTAATGEPWRLALGQGVFVLTAVEPPRPVGGACRPATERDRDLLVRWLEAFEREALQATIRDEGFIERDLASRLGPETSAGFSIWDEDGQAVSLTGWRRIPGGARIGPVYTPPDVRGRGYASNLVAEVSAEMLERGSEACFLYTDLGNPTSNAIYRRLGYERIGEASMIVFGEE